DSAERAADALAADSRRGSAPVMRPSTAAPTDDLLGASGSPLPGPLAGDFGRRFNHDFGRVRVFHDDKAADAADAFNAAAFTVGQNIYFGHGAYQPGSAAGDALLTHELGHVIADHGRPLAVRRGGPAGDCAGDLENVDEENDDAKTAGLLAHKQIQAHY